VSYFLICCPLQTVAYDVFASFTHVVAHQINTQQLLLSSTSLITTTTTTFLSIQSDLMRLDTTTDGAENTHNNQAGATT
jgi:hypothetical protein